MPLPGTLKIVAGRQGNGIAVAPFTDKTIVCADIVVRKCVDQFAASSTVKCNYIAALQVFAAVSMDATTDADRLVIPEVPS